MTSDLKGEIQADIRRIEKELGLIRQKLKVLEQRQADDVPPVAKLEGAWEGADFTEEEIDAAKIKSPSSE